MFKRVLSVVVFFSLCMQLANAQSKKVWLDQADQYYTKRDFANAALYYSKILDDSTILKNYVLPYEPQLVNLNLPSVIEIKEGKKDRKLDSTNISKEKSYKLTKYDYILYRLAQSYRQNYDYNHAAEAFRICAERGVYGDAGYLYGLCLMNIKDYSNAMKAFMSYTQRSNAPDSLQKLARRRVQWCYEALDTLVPKRAIVRRMDSLVFNAGTSNFGVMYYLTDDKVVFTSARKGGVVADPEKQDSRYFCDLYTSTREDTIWLRPVNFGRPVNTSLHEGAGVFTPDEVMLFTRWSEANRNEAYIYMARTNGGRFYEAMKLGTNINRPGFKTQQPFVTADGKRLIFSSNRAGGFGGFDLWWASIDDNGFIGEAVNLGKTINTPADEITPFFHDISNTLFFSSNGLQGLGGFDIYKSSLNIDDSVFAEPVNLHAPINSEKDDAYYVTDKMGGTGFFSSDRKDCPGGHCYNIYSYINDPIKFDIDGHVYDNKTNDPIANALVTIKDVHDRFEPFYVVTDANGYYQSDLKPNEEYFLKAQKNKFFGKPGSCITKGFTDSHHFEQDFYLDPIPEGDIEIEGVEYDFNKATLRPKSMEVLDKIVDLLKLNDNLSIELSSHTDSRGNDDYNMRLSQARAQSCVDYMVSKGISIKRMIAHGYGETRPIIVQSVIDQMVDKSPEFEAAHQKNRRTAFRVIGETNINVINSTK